MFKVSTTSFHTSIDERRLVAERAKFAKHVMVSVDVCFGGKGRLHFIPDTARVNGTLYVKTLLPEFVQDCRSVLPFLPSGFIFQQDGASAHRQSWLKIGLLPTAVNSLVKMNGLWTRLTSTLWTLPCPGSYAWMLQVISTQAGEHRWAQESPAVDMGAATGLDQQSHIELPEKDFGLVWKLVMDTLNIR